MRARALLGLRSRWSVYGGLIAVVAVALLAGFSLPFVLGERPPAQRVDLFGDAPLGGEVRPGALAGEESGQQGEEAGDAPGAGGDGVGGEAAPEGAGPDQGGATPAGGPLTASDVGVSASAITLGVMVSDLGVFADIQGVPTAAQVEAQWRAYADRVNAAGGVLGRRLDLRFARFNALGGADAVTAACTSLTQGARSFAVMNSGAFYSALCVVQDHRTPMFMPYGQPDDYYSQNPGLLWTLQPRGSRMMRIWVDAMAATGLLAGHRVGIVSDTYPEVLITTRDYLVPLLDRAGSKAVHLSEISYDSATAQTQIPVEVQRMQAAQADVVMITANPLTAAQYLQHANAAGYHPQWVVSDFEALTADAAGNQLGPAFDGGIGFTTTRSGEGKAGVAEAAYDRDCRERGAPDAPRDSAAYFFAMAACTIVDQFVAAATRAGPNLTRASLAAALAAAGSFDVGWQAGGSWSASKPDAADGIRRIRYARSCGCYRPVDATFMATP